MKLFVKNMVCERCKRIIKDILHHHKLHYVSVELGEIDLKKDLLPLQKIQLNSEFHKFGFELVEFEEAILIEKIKETIHALMFTTIEPEGFNLSEHLSRLVNLNSQFLNNLFAEIEGVSLEHYFLGYKINQIKHLLMNEKLNLSQIARKMNYPHTSVLVDQFKDQTGLSPILFKYLRTYQFRLS